MTLPTRVRAGYALGSLVTGSFGTVPGLLLLPYLTDTLGVAAGVSGLVVLAPKAWDVLVNPVAGRISDRTRGRLGARRPYLIGGGLAVAVLFALIFAAPFRELRAAYVAVAFLATATAYAFFQVPYVAMPAEMTDSYTERTRLMTWRVALLALTILIAGAVSPIVAKSAGGGIPGHRNMGIFVAGLIVVGTFGVFLGTRSAPAGTVLPSEPTLRAQLAVAGRNRPFRLLLVCFVVQAAGIATVLAGVKYFATQVLHAPDAGPTLLFVCFVGPAMLVMPLWTRIGARVGKLRAYVLASVLLAGGSLALAARTLDAVRSLRKAVESSPDLRLLPCDTTVVAFTSDEVDLFVLADELAARGWHGQVQFSLGEIPRSIHLTVTAAVAPDVDDFARDLPVAVAAARSFGPATVPDVSDMSVPGLMAALGVTDGRLPERMAPINALLETLPPEVREQLLVGFLSYLQRPSWA